MFTHAEQSAFENFEDPESDPSLSAQSSLWHLSSLDDSQIAVAASLFELPFEAPPSAPPRHSIWKQKTCIYTKNLNRKPWKFREAPVTEHVKARKNWMRQLLDPPEPDSLVDSQGRWAHRPIGNGNYVFKKCGGRWLAKWSVPGISVRMVMLPAEIWIRVIKKILTIGFAQFSPGTYQKGDLMIRTLNHLNDARWFFLESARHKMPLPEPVMRPVKFHKVYGL